MKWGTIDSFKHDDADDKQKRLDELRLLYNRAEVDARSAGVVVPKSRKVPGATDTEKPLFKSLSPESYRQMAPLVAEIIEKAMPVQKVWRRFASCRLWC